MSNLIHRLRESAKAFREHNVYTQDGDPVRLTVQADECEEASTCIEALEDLLAMATARADAFMVQLGLIGIHSNIDWDKVSADPVAALSHVNKLVSDVLYPCADLPRVREADEQQEDV